MKVVTIVNMEKVCGPECEIDPPLGEGVGDTSGGLELDAAPEVIGEGVGVLDATDTALVKLTAVKLDTTVLVLVISGRDCSLLEVLVSGSASAKEKKSHHTHQLKKKQIHIHRHTIGFTETAT